MRYLALGFLLLFSWQPVGAGIYQWTDQQGRVHFSDRPVDAGSKEIRVNSKPSSSNPAESQAERQKIQQRMLDIYQEERLQKREVAEERKQAKKQKVVKCREARSRYDRLNNAGGIYNYDDSGERRYLSEAERERYIAKVKNDVKHWCD